MTPSKPLASGSPRLLIINNMPAFYRTAPFASLVDQFAASTGGVGMVAYQVRRDSHGRGEWFFTPDAELPYPHHFSSPETGPSSRRTAYPLRIDAGLWARYRPTHVFAAGWDSPLSMSAAAYARLTSAHLGVWVESNSTTSQLQGRMSHQYRRAFLRSADFVVVPTSSSSEYVQQLAGRAITTTTLLNPVQWPRLPDSSSPSRLVFLGDFSMRKGFDFFLSALRKAEHWKGIAWGRDVEGLGASAPRNCEIREARPLSAIVPEITSNDVIVIPSRLDPAPLTYSECLALGVRLVVSDRIAYGADAATRNGAERVDPSDAYELIAAAERVVTQPRPDAEGSRQVTPEYWARGVLDGFRTHVV